MCEECDAHLKAARKEAREAAKVDHADEAAVQDSDTSLDEIPSEPDLSSDSN